MHIVEKEAEAKLLEMVSGLKGQSEDCFAIHFHFSRLLSHYRSAYQVKIVINIIKDLFKDTEGVVFVCKDFDLVIIYYGTNRSLTEKVIFQLRYLFMDDPLAYTSDGSENDKFSSFYDLELQWREFFSACRQKTGNIARAAPGAAVEEENQDDMRSERLSPLNLAKISQQLPSLDISHAVRKQPICAMKSVHNIKPIFEEMYINIQHLRKMLYTNIDFFSNKTLFKYLTELLDYNMLAYLTRRAQVVSTSPISLNLNISTVLSDNFRTFDAIVKPEFKSSVIIEIQLSDVFSDMPAFMAAKSSLQRLGYRICMDGLDRLSFLQVDRESLGFNLAKLHWNEDMVNPDNREYNRKLIEAVERFGANRLILSRCDNQEAINFGQSLGISLFQGRHLDKIVNPSAKIIN